MRFSDLSIIAVCITGVVAFMLAFYYELNIYQYIQYDLMQKISLYSFFASVTMILVSIMKAVDKKEQVQTDKPAHHTDPT